MAQTFITALVDLHSVDTSGSELSAFHKGQGYVRRQVEGWSRRYRQALTDDVPDAESVIAWLQVQQPQDVGACVIHNDWRFDNVVLDPGDLSRIRAVLDWELATVGDPFMDLGSALAYWVQADDDAGMQAFRMQPSNAAGMPSREEFVERYCELAGRPRPDWLFYEVFGLFRLAGIAQQIWYRYRNGQTSNPAFAPFGPAVVYLVSRCERLIAQG
jgi:aminoglycoside phosphotransferase (APT) family kinase protein